jgi:hypothetical protein
VRACTCAAATAAAFHRVGIVWVIVPTGTENDHEFGSDLSTSQRTMRLSTKAVVDRHG